MNKLGAFLCALLACSLVLAASAGSVPDDEARAGMRRAFRESSAFFAKQIEKNQEEAEAAKNVHYTIREFQRAIDSNKNAPIPRPTGREVDVYLHAADEESAPSHFLALEPVQEAATEAQSVHDDGDLAISRLFDH